MKKIAALITACAALLLASCGGKTDSNGWYEDFDDAKKACKSSQNILLLVNSYMDYEGSDKGVDFLLNNPDFTKAVKDDFVCVHFDFTDIINALTDVPETATDKEQKAAEKLKAKVLKQSKLADKLAIEQTPQAAILTKEGYFITYINFDYASTSVDGYVSNLKLEENTIKEANDLVAASKKGSSAERLQAIDKLYSMMSDSQKLTMIDLCKTAVSLDKKNEAGLAGKFIITIANSEAYEFLLENNIEKAVDVYKNHAKDSRLSSEDAQSLYMIAANILASSRQGSVDQIIEILKEGYALDTESKYASYFDSLISNLEQMQKGQKETTETQETEQTEQK